MIAIPLLMASCLAAAESEKTLPVPIGIPYTRETGAAFEESGKDARIHYRVAVEANGGRLVPLHQALPPEELARRLAAIRGLLLPGGSDIDPKYYGEAPHEKLGPHDAVFDQFLFDLLKDAEDRRLPVLGICLGMQVLNVHYGGSLYQDLSSQCFGPRAIQHKSPEEGRYPIHPIVLARPSLVHAIFGCERMPVNTRHHQAVKILAPGFVRTAWSDDGVAEAIERPGERFCMGVQFHPERMRTEYPAVNRLFARFIEAARNGDPSGCENDRLLGVVHR